MSHKLLRFAGLAACGFAILHGVLVPAAQAQPRQQAQPQQAQRNQPAGLDALDDERVMTDLANRGLDTLLDHAFTVNKVPPAKQQGIRTLIALRRLSDPQSQLSPDERQELITQITKGIESALPSLTDPKLLMQQASVLITAGVENDVNTLEYWGENPRTQATLSPVVQTVIKILDRAAAVAAEQSERLADQLRSPTDPRVEQYMQLDTLASTAAYTRHMVAYYLALSLDPSDPRRAQVATESADYLAQFDDPDTQVQPIVRNRIAKLHMVKGDFEQARKLFETVATNRGNEIQPPPDLAQQYEARYFSAVVELLNGKPQAAREKWKQLLEWQAQALPADKETQNGVAAAAAMLEYRILSLEAELAKSDTERSKINEQAVAVLMQLVKDRPDLQGIIYEQVLTRLPQDAALAQLDPLLLRALVRRGEQERLKPENAALDTAALQRAIDAARELVARQGSSGVDASLAETSALLIPLFLEKLDRRVEAAGAYLDFVEKFTASRHATAALEQAEVLIGQLRREDRENREVVALLDRFLPLAVNEPFNQKEFALQYATRLAEERRYDEAVKYFRQVPEGEQSLTARFFEMVSLRELLHNAPADAPQRATLLRELLAAADDVTRRASAGLESASDDDQRRQYQSLLTRTALLAADVAWRHERDPQRTLQLLANFEERVKGLPGENELLSEVLFLRVQSYMAAGKTNEATAALLRLLETRPGPQAAQIIYGLLEKLNEDLEDAQAAGDVDQIRTLTANRATLSAFLVDYAETSTSDGARQQLYVYRRFAATTRYEAALLIEDPQPRRAELEAALQQFRQLQSPENHALYAATVNPASGMNPQDPDPQVSLRIGLIAYELGDYAEAQAQLGALLTARKLGTPRIEQIDANNVTRLADNEQYWEAVLKLLRSNVALGTAKDESARYLRQQYIRWGEHVGGQKWKNDFEQLRAELLPDFTPPRLGDATPAAGTQ